MTLPIERLFPLRLFPDPALRLEAREVADFDAELAALLALMRAVLTLTGGVGLAANQVGRLQRVFLFQPAAEQEAQAIVNPHLTFRSQETVVADEACLSLPGLLVPVARAVSVRLAAKSAAGEDVELELADFPARVVQHEIDHLDGVLTIDRVEPWARAQVLAALRASRRGPGPLTSWST